MTPAALRCLRTEIATAIRAELDKWSEPDEWHAADEVLAILTRRNLITPDKEPT